MQADPIDTKLFRKALSRFPTGVTVITTRDPDGRPIGVTASSFNAVSMDPPLILWSVDKSAYSASIFENASHFGVNVLAHDQIDISNRFASRGEDKFKDAAYTDGLGDAPLFEACAAQFECATWNVYDGGDHLILVGEVKSFQLDEAKSPLVFSCGGYAVPTPHPGLSDRPRHDIGQDGFVEGYFLYLLRAIAARFSAPLYRRMQDQAGVRPEEWRVLATLNDADRLSVEQLAATVMQPEADLRDTLDALRGKGLIALGPDESVMLGKKGAALSAGLVEMALKHETDILADAMPESEIHALKNDLKAVLDRLPG